MIAVSYPISYGILDDLEKGLLMPVIAFANP